MIIKNCPAYDDMPNMYDEICGWCKYEHDLDLNKCLCKNINDCIIKQVIEKCKRVDCDCIVDKKNCGQMDNMPECCDLWKSKDILQLFEIEECEDENP